MPKYYISDGNLTLIVDKPTKIEAANHFARRYHQKGMVLGPFIHVNEQGLQHTQININEIFETKLFINDKYIE